MAAGDIGQYFPDTDVAYTDLASTKIVRQALDVALQRGYKPVNIAVVVTLDKPKLGPKRAEIAANIAQIMGLDAAAVGLSFKTSEGLAPQHVQARATVLLARIETHT